MLRRSQSQDHRNRRHHRRLRSLSLSHRQIDRPAKRRSRPALHWKSATTCAYVYLSKFGSMCYGARQGRLASSDGHYQTISGDRRCHRPLAGLGHPTKQHRNRRLAGTWLQCRLCRVFFYVISGFLITYTISKNYEPGPTGTSRFLVNRFIRIFSLYWPVVVLAMLLLPGALTEFANASIADKTTGIFLLGMDWRVTFAAYPETHFAAAIEGLHPAWTLGAELSFYLLAPFLVRSWRLTFTVLLLSVAIRFVLNATVGHELHDIWLYHSLRQPFSFLCSEA
jgi:hypothetical protein